MTEARLPSARDWMVKPALTLSPEDPIFPAIDRLIAARVASSAVLDAESVVGMFTVKDALRAVSQLLYTETAEGASVGDHMSTEFPSCDPAMDFFRVAEQFLCCHFPTLPVIADGRLVGLVDRQTTLERIETYRRNLEQERAREAQLAGRQAERPTGIEASQQAAARTSRDQLVRLFSRRKN